MRFFVCSLLVSTIAVPASADCEVSGVATVERLRVRIAGEELLTLTAMDLPVAVRPGHGGLYRDARVLAPMAFAARSDAPMPWTVARPAELADGMLWLDPNAEVEAVREERDGLEVRVQVDEHVWISRVHVPCGAIALGHAEERGGREPDWASLEGPRWIPRDRQFWMTSERQSGATLRMDAPHGLPDAFVEIDRVADHVRVVARFTSGARVRGWVQQRSLSVAPRGSTEARPFVRRPPLPRTALCRRIARRGEYVGPAYIAPATEIRTAPEGAVWASVAEPAVFTIAWRPGSDWARIVHVPGLRSDARCAEVIRNAWVARSRVELQGEGHLQGGSVPALLLGLE